MTHNTPGPVVEGETRADADASTHLASSARTSRCWTAQFSAL